MKKIRLTPYYGYVFLVRSVSELKRTYKRITKEDLVVAHNMYGLTVTLSRGGSADNYLVYARSASDLAHEFGHVLLRLFTTIGSDPAAGRGEPFCYMLSYLMDEAKG